MSKCEPIRSLRDHVMTNKPNIDNGKTIAQCARAFINALYQVRRPTLGQSLNRLRAIYMSVYTHDLDSHLLKVVL